MGMYETVDSLFELGAPHPALASVLEQNANNALLHTPFSTIVEMFGSHSTPVPPDSDDEFVVYMNARDGHRSEIRMHKPTADLASRHKLVILIHGGGFCLGHNSHISGHARATAKIFNVIVASVSYRLAPGWKFPTAPNDVWDAVIWLTAPKNAEALQLDITDGFYIGGVSAGANLAAVTAQKWLNENNSPKITGIWLSIPMLLDEAIVPDKFKSTWISRDQNSQSLIIDKDAMDFVQKAYSPDVRSPDFSPFNAREPHVGMPPTYLQICGQDPLRDDGLIYERVLRSHGVLTKLDVYPGVPHGFADVLPTWDIAREFHTDTLLGWGWLMGNNPSREECQQAMLAAMALRRA